MLSMLVCLMIFYIPTFIKVCHIFMKIYAPNTTINNLLLLYYISALYYNMLQYLLFSIFITFTFLQASYWWLANCYPDNLTPKLPKTCAGVVCYFKYGMQ